ncbi:unnamed protein product [Cylindrotheca closterium]|uniref:Uncharacterized protein n=1 Tax=Cylindrotheca closterium TaxID=2856 RepID=A0AAD2JLT6_9STRA|nr:unnamed protein product [Cylindrotheca closterium]
MGVTIDPTAAGDHEPSAERNNRTLKERVRVALAQLPYKVVPKVITECLGHRAAELLNVFPQKNSISSHFSDMIAELGQYVHAIGTDDFPAQGRCPTRHRPSNPAEELLADADNDVDDRPELTVRFQGDDDYESDDDLGDEGNEEEEPIVANLDHHQENVDRGTNDIGSLLTDLEDLQEPPEEEIVFEPEEPYIAKVTRSGQTCAQAIISELNLSQVPKRPREWPSSRSDSSANENKNRVATRRKHQERELKPLKNKCFHSNLYA